MEENSENILFQNLKKIAIGLVLSIVITIILIFILSIFLCYSQTSEKIIEPAVICISIISILLGSFFIEKSIREKGLIYGGGFGFLYMMLIYLLSSFISADFYLGISSVIMIVLGIVSGVIGGILGVNIKN